MLCVTIRLKHVLLSYCGPKISRNSHEGLLASIIYSRDLNFVQNTIQLRFVQIFITSLINF